MKKKEIELLKGTLEETIASLNGVVKGLEDRLKKAITLNLNKLEKIEVRASRCVKALTGKTEILIKNEDTIKDALLNQVKAFDGIEDTFFTLYHNIQKNQFLYANNPEFWWEDYLDLKKYYNLQNKDYKKDLLNHKLTQLIESIADREFDETS